DCLVSAPRNLAIVRPRLARPLFSLTCITGGAGMMSAGASDWFLTLRAHEDTPRTEDLRKLGAWVGDRIVIQPGLEAGRRVQLVRHLTQREWRHVIALAEHLHVLAGGPVRLRATDVRHLLRDVPLGENPLLAAPLLRVVR